jgi:hypothetical protein
MFAHYLFDSGTVTFEFIAIELRDVEVKIASPYLYAVANLTHWRSSST